MRVAAKVGRKTIRITNSCVNMFVLIVLMLLLSFGCYAMWDSNQLHAAASSMQYEIYKPTTKDAESFEYLRSINPDVFAWLTVYGTNIDYPLVQGQDNIRYVNTDARGRHSLSGAIFLDHRSAPDFSHFSSIIYGHHMHNRVMFGEIELFADRDFFDARRYGMLYFDEQEQGLEFFAFVHADAYDSTVFRVNIAGAEQQQAYLDTLLRMATHTREDVSVTLDDRIVLLTTCSANSTNGRDVLIGRITHETHDDPFATQQTERPNLIPGIDTPAQVALWATVGIAAALVLLVLLAIVLTTTKRRR